MKIDEALNLLVQICEGYRGNLQEHQTLQEALKTVGDKCKAPKKSEKK